MSKLVYLFKFKKPIAIGIPGIRGGVMYPASDYKQIAEPLPGRPAMGVVYNFEKVMQVNLLPEEPDPLPSTIPNDPELVREYKLSQAKDIANNVRANESILRVLRAREEEGVIECLGRAHVDAKGRVIPEATRVAEKPKVEPKVETVAVESPSGTASDSISEAIVAPAAVRVGRPRKEKAQPTE